MQQRCVVKKHILIPRDNNVLLQTQTISIRKNNNNNKARRKSAYQTVSSIQEEKNEKINWNYDEFNFFQNYQK